MSDDIESRARSQGWVPQEEFHGDAARWVSAEEFVERGERILPIVKSQNRKLESEVARITAENQKLAQLFQASQESIVELQTFHEQNLKERLAAQKQQLAQELAAAREIGDTRAEVDIQTRIAELGQQPAPTRQSAVQPSPQPAAPAVDPALQAWQQENPWFGTDARKTKQAMGIAQLLEADPANSHLTGRAFYDRVVQEMQVYNQPGGSFSKVGSGRPSGEGSGSGGSGGSKSYDSLPPEARAACEQQSRKLVGEGRAFKDMKSWQTYYAKTYYAAEEKRGE